MNTNYQSLLRSIQRQQRSRSPHPIIIGIDGNCGSGKTTLAKKLSDDLQCDVVHLDDFFLPKKLRSKKRRSEIAGNFHYERFKREVIDQLKEKEFEYHVFSCKSMDYQKKQRIQPRQLLIIEGSYSFSHGFQQYYDYRIFLKCSEETQLERIKRRVGQEKLIDFIQIWIPMENRYFEGQSPHKYADYIYHT